MKFSRIQELRALNRKKVQTHLETRGKTLFRGLLAGEERESILKQDSLALAYVGDAYYSLYVRAMLVDSGVTKVRFTHELVTTIISAKGQAQSFLALEESLLEEELQVANKARNANLSVPKSAEVWEYRLSTCLEAVFGYLYEVGEIERLDALCHQALMHSVEAWNG